MALDAIAVARAFEVMLPAHKTDLTLRHNPHKFDQSGLNTPIETYLNNYNDDEIQWVSPIEKQKAHATNELWVLLFYDDAACYEIMLAAATLPALAQWLQDNGLAFGS